MLPELELVPVDESVLEELVAVAVADTDPNDVTPPLEPGWGEARVTWLRDFHRRNRPGLVNGHQLTEAVRVNGRVSGAIRLESLSPVEVECGIWLARSARGRDLSHGVFSLIIERSARARKESSLTPQRETNPRSRRSDAPEQSSPAVRSRR